MRNTTQLYLGLALLIFGTLLLLGNIFNFDAGAFCWPTLLILLGVWLLLRPRMVSPGTAVTQKLLGDIKRRGEWVVSDEDFSLFVGDIDLDLTRAELPPGETRLRFNGFVGDVDLLVPEEVGIRLTANAFVSDVKLDGDKETIFLAPLTLETDGYADAKRQLRIDTAFFVNDMTIRRV